jgi:hypothetical protein
MREAALVRTVVSVAAVALLPALAGCSSSPDINGAVGITVSPSGDPVAVIELCSGVVDEISVAGPNRGTRPNEVHAELTAQCGLRQPSTVDLYEPGEGWRGDALSPPLDDTLYIVIAASRSENSQLTQTQFTPAELGALTPDTVQYSEYDPHDGLRSVVGRRADFHRIACSNRD